MFLDSLYNIVITPIEIIFDALFCVLQETPGIAIIAISLVMNFLALPLYKRADAIQEEERDKTASMKHWVDHIKRTFKGDERYMMLNEYYRIEHYKPIYALRSMFPLLLQIPFFIAAYHYLSTQPMLSGTAFLFLEDLGSPDKLLQIGGLSINLLPIVMTLINVISGYIYLRGFPLKDKIQTYGIAAIFLIILYDSPSGLVFYWTLNQVFSVAKNVFMKLLKKPKTRRIAYGILGILFVIIAALLGQLGTTKRIIAALIILLISWMPLIISVIKQYYPRNMMPAKPVKARYFLLGALFIALFAGLMIPLAVIYSDPAEFVTQAITPLSLIVTNVCIFVGYFVFWLGIYYYLSDTRMRNIFTIAVWLLSGIFLINYLFFAGDYGIMTNDFIYDKTPVITLRSILINFGVVLAAAGLLLFIYKKRKKILPAVYTILIVACIGLSGFYSVNIIQAKNAIDTATESTSAAVIERPKEEKLTLSKNGKNVIVFMVDRAVGCYVPYIFDERPELARQFSGFTHYINAATYGIFTKWGAPGIYGGHDYSPIKMNERSSETLVDKHDEALRVMPELFSKNDFDVTVWNPPLAGYDDPQKSASLYDYNPAIRRYYINDRYASVYYQKYNSASKSSIKNKNLMYYCFFRTLPTVFRNTIYNDGYYLQTEQIPYSDSFLMEYASLTALPEITTATETEKDQFLMLYNQVPHFPVSLDPPDYEPKEGAVVDFSINNVPRTLNGTVLRMDTNTHTDSYAVNITTFIQLGKWLDYLKKQGVYDNTRIIIVSDHGHDLDGQIESLVYDEDIDLEAINCLLMVKDFNSVGDFKISDDFMMNADVPVLATEGLIIDPVNPFTGNKITNDAKKGDVTVTYSKAWEWNQTDTTFDLSTGWLMHLKKKDIFDKNNWEKEK